MKAANNNNKKKPSAQLLGEAIVTYFCLEDIPPLGEYQQLAYMIIISQLSRASLFWCVYLSDFRQSLQIFCIQNKARHSSAKQIINKLISLLLENANFFLKSALEYFGKTLISILSVEFFSTNCLYCSSPHFNRVLGFWFGFFFFLLKLKLSLLFVSGMRTRPFLLIW